MTDTTQVNPPLQSIDPAVIPLAQTPAAPSATGAPSDQSPLDILDNILKDAQAKATEASEEKLANDEKKRVEERELTRQLDQQKVQDELQHIEQMKNSPQYQAMQQQKQEAVVEKQDHQQKMTGMEILQLEHSKL